MKLQEVLRTLESKGTAQNRQVYARHGYPEDTFGVSFGDLRQLAKSLAGDLELARGLWKTGNGDARVLAALIADPQAMTAAEFDQWVGEIRFHVLADLFSQLAGRSPLARKKGEAWRKSKSDHVSQVGWNLVGALAQPASGLEDDYFAPLLDQIERAIHSAPNRTRHAMNMALCAIGGYRAGLRERALAVAQAIGQVEVDHGETGCKTPDAVSYIGRMVAHQSRRKAPTSTRSSGAKKAASRPAGQSKTITPKRAGKSRKT